MTEEVWPGRRISRASYLCGAATHPAGSVIALNGRNAAMVVLEDARPRAGVV